MLNRSAEAHKEAKLGGRFGKDLIAVRETIRVFSVSGKFGRRVSFEFSAYNRSKPYGSCGKDVILLLQIDSVSSVTGSNGR